MATTFIVNCHVCKAKVGVEDRGRIERSQWEEEAGYPIGERIQIGICPSCAFFVIVFVLFWMEQLTSSNIAVGNRFTPAAGGLM